MKDRTSRRKWRFRLRKLSFRLLIIIVVLAVVELVLWSIGGHLYRPITRELGRLDDQLENTFRILCIGDSHTFGMDAPREMSYPAQLERLLNATRVNTRYVVVNQGVPGFNSSQTLNLLREILDGPHPDPQLVLVGGGKNNDHNFKEARFWEAKEMADAPLWRQAAYLLEHSKTYQLGKVTRENLKAGLAKKLEKEYRRVINPKDTTLLTDWLKADFLEMVDLAEGRGARIAFVSYFHQEPFVDSSMLEVSANRSVTLIDVRWPMLPVSLMYGLIGKTGHPNQRGYSRVAKSVFDGLLRDGLIPDSPAYVPISSPAQDEAIAVP